jgi:hypothetical protein
MDAQNKQSIYNDLSLLRGEQDEI